MAGSYSSADLSKLVFPPPPPAVDVVVVELPPLPGLPNCGGKMITGIYIVHFDYFSPSPFFRLFFPPTNKFAAGKAQKDTFF